jgi:hypothetical protein
MLLVSRVLSIFVLAAVFSLSARGQQLPSQPSAASSTLPEQPKLSVSVAPRRDVSIAPYAEHRFWDKENDWLFAGVGASRTFDYFSTLNMRRRGRQEILLTNDLVDNHPAFAAIEAAGTGISIGVSYLFHRYGHHRLERWVSVVDIGITTTGGVRNYCLQTAHLTVRADFH